MSADFFRGAGKMATWEPVYKLVQQIPRGRVLTYGAIAKALRLPGGARTAGRAMAATPSGRGIPWHRVVGERGKILIRGHYGMLQKTMLESEGVAVVESRVKLDEHLWTAVKAKSLPSKKKSAKSEKK
jgi:methylated-DNA-protein-cysteine methyltransferase-like protein